VKILIWILLVVSVVAWAFFGSILLGIYGSEWLNAYVQSIKLPSTTAELGDSFGVLSAFMSPVALILALAAMLVQSKQQLDSNVIGAYSARQQFLLMECDRLEASIQDLKRTGTFDEQLFNNMVHKKSRYLNDAKEIDVKITTLLNGF
jgi:hypothetical protein